MSLKRKQMSIDLKTKQLILVEVEKGTLPKTKIAEKFGIPKSTLSTIIKNKDKIDEAVALGSTNSTKRLRKPMLEDVEKELLKWFKKARDSNIPLSGALVREKAKEICTSNGVEHMACSDGWLWRFQKRYNISCHVLSGEANKVADEDVNKWLQGFVKVRQSYSKNDIFNIDETGVFYNLLPDRSLDFKGVKSHGGAKSKERLTVVLCCNSTGSEKLKLWVIGKYQNPRCFKNVNKLSLPFEYTNQKNAWVDSTSFRLWLLKFQRKMALQNRNVLLTMDNCSAHNNIGDLELPNVKIVYFPPNCTSRLQPLDQGIIAAFKRYFKTRLVRHALLCLDSDQPCVKWNILQAMRAMAVSWNDVTATTISNCFKKAWNIENDANLTPEIHIEDVIEDDWNKLLAVTSDENAQTFSSFIQMDNDLDICDENAGEDGEDENPEISDQEIEPTEPPVDKPSRADVLAAFDTLVKFSQTSAELDCKFDDQLNSIRKQCLENYEVTFTQKPITDFFKPT
ncbi:tigger transposable element-derived protein 6-like [Metopolophium dirhodum]|uniref:tigger transposable element-derived protein 6-like n=1 Tax=Metopolophium dirhodum TaxID=44670 RepID=UPI00299055C2|nr:tigger transposable element-derived protein 6-like [Metopolophium dirhodum]XP_060882115.1 tigger transposable element-derived protein 6-like [Metopolophium dirhodum]